MTNGGDNVAHVAVAYLAYVSHQHISEEDVELIVRGGVYCKGWSLL